MSLNLYKKPTQVIDLHNTGNGNVVGADMRQVLKDILYTDDQGEWVIYRRAQIENGHPKRCKCRDGHRSGEADRDIPCIDCDGMGYYYNDILTRTYINNSQAYSIYQKYKQEGKTQVEYRTSYFEWDFIKKALDDGDNIPNKFDRIIQIKKDIHGKILSPSTLREVYEILSVDPYRLDNNGRIEYYRVRIISVVDKSFLV